MELSTMKEKLENHEGRLIKVEITQEVHTDSIVANGSRLDKLITQQNRIFILIALMTGAYMGTDKVMALVGRFVGG